MTMGFSRPWNEFMVPMKTSVYVSLAATARSHHNIFEDLGLGHVWQQDADIVAWNPAARSWSNISMVTLADGRLIVDFELGGYSGFPVSVFINV